MFFVILFFQMLTGYLPSFFTNIATQYLTSDSNIQKYDFSFVETKKHSKAYVSPLFTEEFYVDSKSH